MSTALAPRARRGLTAPVAGGTALLLVVALALLVHGRWSPLLGLDRRVSGAAEDLVVGAPGLLGLARAVTLLGDPRLLTALTAVAVVVLLRRGRPRPALFLLASRAGALLLSGSLKVAVGRERPVFADPVDTASGWSFPSGHALGSAAFWLSAAVVALALLPSRARRPVLAGALAVAVLVAASRVLLGVHFLSDAVAGCVLGLGWAAACAALFALPPYGRRR